MTKTLKHIVSMKAALWVNAFCYYFKRLWLIGKWMPDSIYSQYELKNTLAVIAVIMQQFTELAGKPLYLLFAVVLPLFMMSIPLQTEGFPHMVQFLFFLNCITGSFGDSQIFTVTRDKITSIKYLHMNPRTYIQGFLAFKYVPYFLYYLPCLLISSVLLGGTLLQGFFLWLMLLSFRMMGEAFQLFLFDRTGKVMSRNMLYAWLLIVIGLAGAYLPSAFRLDWRISDLLLHPLCVAGYTLPGILSFWYITVGYGGYEQKLHQSIDIQFLLSSILKTSSGNSAAFKEVEIKEKDTQLSENIKENFKDLTGYAYINALFFARHRRQLIRPVYFRLIATALIFAASVILFILNREAAVLLSKNMTSMLPFFVYIMYFMTVADKASRAMFHNCDKDMLRYAYYRQPQTILRNFQIRFLRISLYDLSIAGAMCLAAAGFCLLCRTSIFTTDFMLFCTTLLLLSILFTVHHLCLYYIFQPYSESLQVKNPFYSIINIGMYVLCFLCLKINVGGFTFTIAVLLFTIIYIFGALALVYYRAPKSFRVK